MEGGGIRVVARWEVGEGTAFESGIVVLVWFKPKPKPTLLGGVIGDLSSLGPYSLSLVVDVAFRGLGGCCGIESLEGSFGVKDCERVWTWVGEVVIEIGALSMTGAETEMETDGKLIARGGEDEGGVELEVGKMWRPLGLTALEGEGELALLRLRLRYSNIRSWNEGLTGENSAVEILLKSSADFDHPFLEMFLRSPRPVGGLELGP